MLRFQPLPYASGQRNDEWPEFSLSEPSTVFSARPPLRKLVAVVDHELLAALDEEDFSERTLLGGLFSDPFIELYRISDHGPPEDAARVKSETLGEYVRGWIVLGERVAELDHLPIFWSDPDGRRVTRGALIGNGPDVAESDTSSSAYADLGPDEAAAQRRLDALAVQAAGEAHADLFITERPYLHSLTWGLARGVVIATPEQALPLVSLYLRGQGVFVTYRSLDGTATSTLNRGLFYWVGTRDLLPAGWRWFKACVQHGRQDASMTYLAQSLFQRVQRALQARDAAHQALNRPQTNDTADDALGNLDLVLLGLMAGVDVTARVAHRPWAWSEANGERRGNEMAGSNAWKRPPRTWRRSWPLARPADSL